MSLDTLSESFSFKNLFGFYAFFDEPERLQTAPTKLAEVKKSEKYLQI